MKRLKLQGHADTEYDRYIRKGEYELRFTKNGVHYRPWFELAPDSKDDIVLYHKELDHSGTPISLPCAPAQHMEEDIRSGRLNAMDPSRGGYFDLSGYLVGDIVQTCAVKDEITDIWMAQPNNLEMKFFVTASRSGKASVETGNRKTNRELDVKEGGRYFYFLVGAKPSDWVLKGPFDPSDARPGIRVMSDDESETLLEHFEQESKVTDRVYDPTEDITQEVMPGS